MKALVGTRKGLLILKNTGDQWEWERDFFEGVSVPFATYDPHNEILWAGLSHGHWGPKVHLSRDGGCTFEEVETPRFPEASGTSLKAIWSIEADPSKRVYIGTEPAALFWSEDLGRSWTLNVPLFEDPQKKYWVGGGSSDPCLHSILIHPDQPNHLLVGISVAGVLASTDRGDTWVYRNKGIRADYLPDPRTEVGHDPHKIVATGGGNTLWQQNHCGLFKSEDFGRNWQDFSTASGVKSCFGFAVAVPGEDEETVYTVPALSDENRIPVNKALMVQRSSNGGQSWECLEEGLPQSFCYDICLRHALAVHGHSLMFGTSTGNLFVSHDGGDSWSQSL